ncbi:hypothetical protein [Portibacter marinus]|uniref:hypothetical protein n=1 Tax=Portibacter marinus TaxID=2898660 RepID=UPI001F3016C5|nr:hypothetical protein [Portibacter marinus]
MRNTLIIASAVIGIGIFFYFKNKTMEDHTTENPSIKSDAPSQDSQYDFVVSETGSISINNAQLLFGGIAEREVNGSKEVNVQIDVDMKEFIFPKEGDTIILNDDKFHIAKFEKPESPGIGRVFINRVKE